MSINFVPQSSAIAALESEINSPGGLSIVVQGGLFRSNLSLVANYIRHLQELFPSAQIILAVSSSDMLWRDESSGEPVRTTPERLRDTTLADALEIVFAEAEVTLARGGLPLPAIKSNIRGQNNNFNLQLAAAKTGLALARGKYTLRLRNDLHITDRSFLRHYAERVHLPRLKPVFSQRILVSSIFSLNPYTLERMPFHFSDWFHFGLTADIVDLWQVDPIAFADATYFRTRPHPEGSNAFEKLLDIRIAVEQHLNFSFYRKKLNLEMMDQFNDCRHRDLSMQILLDDFVLIHPGLGHVLFDKYAHTYNDKYTELACIWPKEWDYLAANRHVEPKRFFAPKMEAAKRLFAISQRKRKVSGLLRRARNLIRVFPI